MSRLTYYAGLGSARTPVYIENVMRRIGRLFASSRVLRTTGCLGGDDAFYDGAVMEGAIQRIELYSSKYIQAWMPSYAEQLDPCITQMPPAYRQRAQLCVHTVLGIDGCTPVSDLIVWLEPEHSGPQYWAILAAQAQNIPVHNLADDQTFQIWADWVKEHSARFGA